MSTAAIRRELRSLDEAWKEARSGDGHGGSPGEWIWERASDLDEVLQKRRAKKQRKTSPLVGRRKGRKEGAP